MTSLGCRVETESMACTRLESGARGQSLYAATLYGFSLLATDSEMPWTYGNGLLMASAAS